MIKIGNIRENFAGFEKWAIVRSYRRPIAGVKHEPLLSPSPELFGDYWAAAQRGEYDAKWFREIYVPRFIREIAANDEALALLDSLYNRSRSEDILLCCFCTDEATCHRSIVAGLLAGAGADIECDESYKGYWDMFLEACREMKGA